MSDSRLLAHRNNSRPWARKIGLIAMVGLIAASTLASFDADAKRMGGGRSFGRQADQSSMMQRSTPPAQPSPGQQPGQAAQAQRAQPQPAPGAAAAAQPNRSRWLG